PEPPAPAPYRSVEPPPVKQPPVQPAPIVMARVDQSEPPLRATNEKSRPQGDGKRAGIFGATTFSILFLVLAAVILYQTDSLRWWTDFLARIRPVEKTSGASSSQHEPMASEARPAPSSEPVSARKVETAVAKPEVRDVQQAPVAGSDPAGGET